MIEFIYRTVLIGIGATALLDLWVLFLQRFFRIPAPNWKPVGRWFCNITEGKVLHDDIALARPLPHEHAVGWLGHHAVGIVYAGLLLALARPDWPAAPSPAPALAVGLVTVGASWFLLKPGIGAGIVASKRPNPRQVRTLNIADHMMFGLEPYGSALLIR